MKSAWCTQYGFVDADQTDAVGTRKDRGIRPGPLSLPGSFHRGAHWQIKQLYAMLKDRKKSLDCDTQTSAISRRATPFICLLQGQSFYKKGPWPRSSPVRPPSPLALATLGLSLSKDLPLLSASRDSKVKQEMFRIKDWVNRLVTSSPNVSRSPSSGGLRYNKLWSYCHRDKWHQ